MSEKEPEEATEITEILLDAAEFPVGKAIVYNDCAQVERTVKAKLEKKGFYYIILQGVSSQLNSDSIRVEGKGEATLLDITYSSESRLKQDPQIELSGVQEKLAAEKKNMEDLKKQHLALTQEKESEAAVLNILNSYGSNLSSLSEKKPEALLSTVSVEGLERFLKLYQSNRLEHERQKAKLEFELSEVQKDITAAKENISRWERPGDYEDVHEIKIYIESEQDCQDIELLVSYIVDNASWTPIYDARVDSENQKLDLIFKADVKQGTGEPWVKANLVLSTARPSVSGNETPFRDYWNVNIYVPEPVFRGSTFVSGAAPPMMMMMAPAPAPPPGAIGEEAEMAGEGSNRAKKKAAPKMRVKEAATKTGVHATTFDIPVKQTIPSDYQPHRVAVTGLHLKPNFSHSTYPKLNSKVYLKAKVTNETQFPLLSGICSVFLDGSFVTKTNIENVSPNEEFEFSLGIDEAVRVAYKPLLKTNESVGILNKQQVQHFHRSIVVHNTKSTEVTLKVVDQLPKSVTVDKVKVTLIEPIITPEKSQDAETVTMGDFNCVEWLLKLKPQEERKIEFKFDVAYPLNEKVTGI